MAIWIFETYRAIILEKIRENKSVRGYQSLMASSAQCHASFFSHVLKGESQLTPDQASALCDFWNLNRNETEYFLTLVNLERSASDSLKSKLKVRLDELRHLTDSLPVAELVHVEMDYKDAIEYYSNWHSSTIRVALRVPGLNNAQALASKFFLPIDIVEKVLLLLERMNMIERDGEGWKQLYTGTGLHKNREIMGIHHRSIRQATIAQFEKNNSKNLHATMIFAVNKQDQQRIREIVREASEQIIEIAAASTDNKEVCAITCDSVVF